MNHKTQIANFLEQIALLIGDDRLPEAIEQLRQFTRFNRLKEDKEMLLLMMESKSLEFAFIHERIDWSTYNSAKRKLALRVLSLIDLMEKYHSLEYPQPEEKKIKKMPRRA